MINISIKTKDYYDHPEYYAFMPPSIFNALEESELKGAIQGQEIMAEVPEADWNRFMADLTEYKNKLTNGCKDG